MVKEIFTDIRSTSFRLDKAYRLPITYMAILYLDIFLYFLIYLITMLMVSANNFQSLLIGILWLLLPISILATVIIWIGCIIDVFRKINTQNSEFFFHCNRLLTYGLVPFYVFFFGLTGGLGLVTVFTFGAFFPIFFAMIQWLILSIGALHGIIYLSKIRHEGGYHWSNLLLHGLLHLCFVLNVFDTMYLSGKKKKGFG